MPAKRSNRAARRGRPSGERQYGVVLNRTFQGSQPHSSFPDRTELMLDYWSSGRVNPGVVAAADEIYNVNSLFDPDYSGTGHQPREFDTWATIYNRYRVLEVMAEVDVRQRASHGITVTVVPSNSPTALVASDYPQELPRAVRLGVTGSNQPVARWAGRIDPRAILGMTPEEFRGDDSTGAQIAANPGQPVFMHLFVAQVDGTTACDFEYTVRLRFRAEFYDRKTLSPSALVAAVLARAQAPDEQVDDDASAPVLVSRPPHTPPEPSTDPAGRLPPTFPDSRRARAPRQG